MSDSALPKLLPVIDFNQDLRSVIGKFKAKLIHTSPNTKDYKYLVAIFSRAQGIKEEVYWVDIEGKDDSRTRIVENVPQLPCLYFNIHEDDISGHRSLMSARHDRGPNVKYMLKVSYNPDQPVGSQWTWEKLPL